MEVESSFQCQLRNLKMDDPRVAPKTWESIVSESGTARTIDTAQGPQDTMYDLSAVSEASLVGLVINALQGVKSSIIEIDKLSLSFCSSPADRSYCRVPSLWCRLSSTHALGRMLKSISHSGLLFFFLHEFVSHFLGTDHNANSVRRDNTENFLIPSNREQGKIEIKECPPYSLVNQAFAVAIGKLLEGYLCALSTLSASIKLRRSVQCKGEYFPICQLEGTLTSVVHPEITFMEIYLHTKELRMHIETLGSICFSQTFIEVLSLDSIVDFHNFPRGADLLTYLYIHLQDADPVHHALLKYLFIRSYKPYCGFIKLWMYRATIDDPYGEFFVESSDTTTTTDASSLSLKFSLATIKELSGVSIPCFLKDVCYQLLRAGQQLQVLLKLLDLCDLSFSGENVPCDLSVLREILPFWVNSSSELDLLSNPLIFDINVMEDLIQKRDIKYRNMMEKLQNYLLKLSGKERWSSHNVIAFGSLPILLGRSGLNVPCPSVFDGESNFIHRNTTVASDDNAFSDASSSSTESAFELELSLSSECSSHDYNDESISENFYDLNDNICRSSKSMFSKLPADHAKNSILQTYAKTSWPCLRPPSFLTFTEHLYPITFCSHLQHQNRKTNQISASPNSDIIKDLRIFENFTELCQSGGCWPLGGLLSNPFCAYMKCGSPQQLQFTECCFKNDDGGTDKFSCEEEFFAKAFGSFMLSFDGSREMQTPTETFGSLSHSMSSFSQPYAFSTNPMLAKPAWLPTVGNSKDTSFITKDSSYLRNFNFSSVTDPFKLHSESLPLSSCDRSKAEASLSVQLGGSVGGVDYSTDTIKATVENQPISVSLCSAGEANLQKGAQLPNASGGADWAKSLKYPIKNGTYGDDDVHSEQKFLIPLDIIVDRCIIQEILLQYKYISFFTIKFLEEGFSLREHLLALRRYHFMEISDWADLFVMSLGCQKWSAFEHEEEASRIQGLLDLALQRSSCENDPYKERLFIYIKGESVYEPVIKNGIHAFDFVALGYRVDWPVNLVVTQEALQIYADIFSYLIQIRLAVASLIDVWHYLKDALYILNHGQQRTFREMEDFNSLMRMRQQIYHFVTTLQQYVQSQLSDVSWCRFQDSLKHTVKDILDLESVHMLYLADAVHICFLSDDAKEVATIIKNILQCALDFRLCFSGNRFSDLLHEKDESYLRSQIDFTQVSTVNTSFKKNLKELYLLYIKSPKHREFSLYRFWNHLNFNGYFSTIINKESGCSYL
ncbi:hypothetical protein KFK09_016227 [Dendrobium nobile]|uniref:Gamma-tubulin complex component n=2 Tax=Dendrobium nobile TaxID=94219 RepID=A0A8T3AXP5_DENNO|nr:hypothetical protein KFK09_016227 [Dendrobium nobile]